MKKENIYYLSFSIFFSAIILFATSLDPDMFWHINNGKTILQNGITEVNIQSYSQGYFISHSWLYDVLIFSIYNIAGYMGLKVMTSIFVACSIFLMLKLIGRRNPNLLLLFCIFGIYYLSITRFLEVRPQQISLFLTVMAIYIIEEKKANPIYMFIIGVFFANVHGGAIIQLLTIVGLYLLCDIIKVISGKNLDYTILKNIGLCLISIIAGSFVNPYGKEILLYPFKNLSQGIMEANIHEWFPLIDTSKDSLGKLSLFLLILSIASLAYSRKATVKEVLFISFAIMSSILYRRMYLLGTVLVIVFAYEHIEMTFKDVFNKINIKNNIIFKVFNNRIFCNTILAFSLIFFFVSSGNIDFEKNIKASVLCPEPVLQYIEQNNIDVENNVTFNHFNFGGYLQFKGYRTFVDGRADAFLSTYGNNEPIFEHYISILEERIPDKTNDWVNKYNIKYFIIYSQDIVNKSGESDSFQEYLEYSKIATTLFDDGKYAFMEILK